MGALTIRNVNDETKQALRLRAARHGVSMEQEIRTILDDVAKADQPSARGKEDSLYAAIRKLVEPYGGFELEIPEREPLREPPRFK